MATCPSCGKENPDGFRFCGFCTAPLAETEPRRSLEERKVCQRPLLRSGRVHGPSEAADPEDVRARIRPYHARLREEIERYGGTVEKFVGDAVMAVFGAPVAHEDDAERAVRAGLRILEAIEELNAADPGRAAGSDRGQHGRGGGGPRRRARAGRGDRHRRRRQHGLAAAVGRAGGGVVVCEPTYGATRRSSTSTSWSRSS